MDERRYVQLISALISAFSIAYIAKKSKRASVFRAILIAPLVLFLHNLIFYLAVFLFTVNNFDEVLGFHFVATGWSAGIRLHANLTAFFLTYALLRCFRFNGSLKNG